MNKHSDFLVHSESPYNAEPPLHLLRENFVTPRELFYARNHGIVPEIDAETYRLVVDGMVNHPLELTLHQLVNDFPKRTMMATLQCAGNRRTELIAIAPTPGETPWEAGAIGNTTWSGASLKEVLTLAGVQTGVQHVAFLGADEVIRHDENVGFGGSIPLDKALSDETLIAYEMNGEPLSPGHGFPLRIITPGYIGARSVKWLTRITLQSMPSQNYFQAHAYQLFPPHINAETADWNAGLQLGELEVNCVICMPGDGETVSGDMTVQGYAISGGGHDIARVDVSSDGGNTWTSAQLTQGNEWAWTFWETRLQLEAGDHEIIARAFDSASNTQPEEARRIWNFKGYMNNAWHRVTLHVK